MLVLHYKKRNNHKIFDWIAKLIVSDKNIDETFKYMYQSIMTIKKIMPVKIGLS